MSSETDNKKTENAPETGAGSEKRSEKSVRKPRKSSAEKKTSRARKTTGVKKAAVSRKPLRKKKTADQVATVTTSASKMQEALVGEEKSPNTELLEEKASGVAAQVSVPAMTSTEPAASCQSGQSTPETTPQDVELRALASSKHEEPHVQETKETKPVPELSSPVKEAESENQVDQAQKEKESEEPIQESADKAQLNEKTEEKDSTPVPTSTVSQDELQSGRHSLKSEEAGSTDANGTEATESPLLPQICKSLWAKLAVVLVVVVLCCTLPYWWYFKRAVDLPKGVNYVDVTVPAGASGRAIANRIAQAGIGVSPDTLIGLLRVQGTSLSIHAGRYRFTAGMTLAGIVDKLKRSDVEKFSFRIADGIPLWDLRKAVTALPDIEIKTAGMSDMQLRSVLGIQEPHLEGVFAPETYSFRTGLTDIDVYRAAYREQMRILDAEWEKKSPLAAVKTKYEALILASIIEKETSLRADRALVSSVFNNRLRLRMPLQTDPTIIYGLGENFDGNLRRRDLQQPGPYNTYLNAGLPPTPISMPSAASIHAALNPEDTKFLYFVARGDGTTHFSKTLTEHNRAVEKYQKAPARKARAMQKRQNDAR